MLLPGPGPGIAAPAACRPSSACERLVHDLFGLHRLVRRGESGTTYRQFTLPHGEWIRAMAGCGLVVEDLAASPPPIRKRKNGRRRLKHPEPCGSGQVKPQAKAHKHGVSGSLHVLAVLS